MDSTDFTFHDYPNVDEILDQPLSTSDEDTFDFHDLVENLNNDYIEEIHLSETSVTDELEANSTLSSESYLDEEIPPTPAQPAVLFRASGGIPYLLPARFQKIFATPGSFSNLGAISIFKEKKILYGIITNNNHPTTFYFVGWEIEKLYRPQVMKFRKFYKNMSADDIALATPPRDTIVRLVSLTSFISVAVDYRGQWHRAVICQIEKHEPLLFMGFLYDLGIWKMIPYSSIRWLLMKFAILWPCLSIPCAMENMTPSINSELVEYFRHMTTANPNCYVTFMSAHSGDTVFPVADVKLELCVRLRDKDLPSHLYFTDYERSRKFNLNLKMGELETQIYLHPVDRSNIYMHYPNF